MPIEHPKKSHHLNDLNAHNKKLSKINTCKGLQRKLEQKVERAKKNFLQNEKFDQLENDIIVSFDQRLYREARKFHDDDEHLSNYWWKF